MSTLNYILQLQFGDTEIPLTPNIMKIFNITQDLNRFVPSCRIRLEDSSDTLSHVVPFDSRMNKIHLQCRRHIESMTYNAYDFDVY